MNTTNIDERIERPKMKINDFYGGDDGIMVVIENQLAIMQLLKLN